MQLFFLIVHFGACILSHGFIANEICLIIMFTLCVLPKINSYFVLWGKRVNSQLRLSIVAFDMEVGDLIIEYHSVFGVVSRPVCLITLLNAARQKSHVVFGQALMKDYSKGNPH